MQRDFTLEAYRALLDGLRQVGYRTCRVVDALRMSAELESPHVILRHDVDRRPQRSLDLARLEHAEDCHATYYVRTPVRGSGAMLVRELREMGHEVGYHYETISRAHGDLREAARLFVHELSELRELVPIETAAMHGSPLSPWSNMDVWQVLSQDAVGLVGEAYVSLEGYPGLVYVNDTGRSWGNRHNLRDRLKGSTVEGLADTESLLAYVREARPRWLYLQTHPERWVSAPLSWVVQYAVDAGVNAAKTLIRLVRAGRG